MNMKTGSMPNSPGKGLTGGERFCDVGDVTLCYETFGDAGDPAVLLVMGLGTQMIAWHEDFCEELAGRGFHVIRFDNRDVGRSTSLDHVQAADRGEIVRRRPRLPRRTRCPTWPPTPSACSTRSISRPRTWWAPRWAA